ncbi:MAG: hypothetical protein P4L10_07235 [Acidobacteriaceae bacterium]|nr:hypothetical protein [Acidobacteriaceae bacterium]
MDKAQEPEKSGTAGTEPAAGEVEEMKTSTKLAGAWVFWAQFQGGDKDPKIQMEKEYMQNLQAVGDFDNLITFCQLWNNLPHGNPAGCFTVFDERARVPVQALYSHRITGLVTSWRAAGRP